MRPVPGRVLPKDMDHRQWGEFLLKLFRGVPSYDLTDAERTAGVTIVDYSYPPGDLRRYGAVGDGSNNDTTAMNAALAANEDVYDPFGGTFELDNIDIPASYRTIRGLGPGRTVFRRRSTNPVFKTTTARTFLTFRDCTIDGDSEYTSDVCNFVAGTNDVFFDNVEFINFDSGSSNSTALEWATATGTANERIKIRNCSFNNRGGSVSSNYNTVIIYNPNGVTVEGCLFHTCGNLATAFNASYTSVAGGNIKIRDNTFIGVDSSVVLIRVNGANILENVDCSHNTFIDCSPTLGKYCMSLGHQAPTTTNGVVRNITAMANVGRLTDVDCDGFILVGDTSLSGTATNITINGNTVDFRDSSGAVVDTGNADQRGIWLSNCRNFCISDNTIIGAQSAGIIFSAGLNGSITGNTIMQCVQNSASGGTSIESGIYLAQGTTARITITGNSCLDCGGGGAGQAGIGSNSSSTITDILCADNNCEDSRGTPEMVYGFNFGAAAQRVVYGVNRVRNPLTSDYNAASPGVVTYSPSNVTTDRTYDADTALLAEVSDVLGTLIADLQAKGIIQ